MFTFTSNSWLDTTESSTVWESLLKPFMEESSRNSSDEFSEVAFDALWVLLFLTLCDEHDVEHL